MCHLLPKTDTAHPSNDSRSLGMDGGPLALARIMKRQEQRTKLKRINAIHMLLSTGSVLYYR